MYSVRTLAACLCIVFLLVYVSYFYWDMVLSYDGVNLSSCFNSFVFINITDLFAAILIYGIIETDEVRRDLQKEFPTLWRIREYIYIATLLIVYLHTFGYMM